MSEDILAVDPGDEGDDQEAGENAPVDPISEDEIEDAPEEVEDDAESD